MRPVDYGKAAPVYDGRYRDGGPAGIAALVRARAAGVAGGRLLEVGCGTGRWLEEASAAGARVIGLDPSAAMLGQARARDVRFTLVRGRAEGLPLLDRVVSAVVCIYVVHHLEDPARFVSEAARVLAPGGSLDVLALAPHDGADRWYLYDAFPGMREADQERYPRTERIRAWMAEAGLEETETAIVARLAHEARGAAMLEDPILHRQGTCQLSLLDDREFEEGMARIREKARDPEAVFVTDLRIFGTRARKPRPR